MTARRSWAAAGDWSGYAEQGSVDELLAGGERAGQLRFVQPRATNFRSIT
ncbi:hypothetical protein ACQPYH_04220 [Kribbella sp. CA-245084]